MHTGLYTKIIRSTPIVFVVFHVTFYTLNINLKIVSHLLIEYHTIIFFIRNTDHVIHNQCLLCYWGSESLILIPLYKIVVIHLRYSKHGKFLFILYWSV